MGKSDLTTSPYLLVKGTKCTPSQTKDQTCALMSSWASVEAAERSALAAERTVDLGVAGLLIGFATLTAAAYAAVQAKRAADAAIRDANANAESANELASERERQLVAQARLHGAKFTFPISQIQFESEEQCTIRLMIENSGETAGKIESAFMSLYVSLEGSSETIIDRRQLEIPPGLFLLPGEQHQIAFVHPFQQTFEIVGAMSWFQVEFRIDLQWIDTFDFQVNERWIGQGTSVVQPISNSITLRLASQERSAAR